MITKIYEQTKKYIKKQYKFLIILLTTFILFTIKLPFYIEMPGGAINTSKRIEINENKELSGSLNYAYVSEINATIPTYLIAKINKNWDIIKKEETKIENESIKDMQIRNQIGLKESMSNALYAGFKETNEDFEVINNKIYATYIFEQAKTDIKVGDQIIEIDNIKITNKDDLKQINNKNKDEEIKIKVLNNNKEYIRTASLIEYEGKIIIGIGISETYDIKSKHEINIKYSKKESGPSGGLMTALTVYTNLSDTDLTKNRKIVGTGTIDKEGNIGQISGVKYKLIGAVKKDADIFLVPMGENYDEAIKIKNERKYDIQIIGVSTLKHAINELNKN